MRLLLFVLTALTAVALGLTGEVSVLAFVVPLAGPIGLLLERRGTAPGRISELVFRVASVGFLLYFVFCVLTARLLAGASALTLPVQAWLLLLPATLPGLRRLAILAFFQLVALSAATTMIAFLPLLLAFIVLAPPALTLLALEAHAGRGTFAPPPQRRPVKASAGLWRGTLAVSLLLLVGGALGFVALPRYEAGFLQALAGSASRLSGFSDTVHLGDINGIKESREVVLRVNLQGDLQGVPLWRGIALDHFTGSTWSVGTAERFLERGRTSVVLARQPQGARRIVQDIIAEPSNSRAFFHLAQAVELDPDGPALVEHDGRGNLRRASDTRGRHRYVVVSYVGGRTLEPLDDDLRQDCLQLPSVDPGVERLAHQLLGNRRNAGEGAARLEAHLQRQYRYSLAIDDRGVQDPIARFLLDHSPGHCEYFASAMAVLLRIEGIPARVVNGFRGGSWSTFQEGFVVRRSDAHSWVEAWIDGRGWVAYDPTPVNSASGASPGLLRDAWEQVEIFWDDHVIGYSYTYQLAFLRIVKEQLALLKRASSGHEQVVSTALGGLALLAASLALLSWLRGRGLRGQPRPTVRFYRAALARLRRRGFRLVAGQTPAELAAAVASAVPAAGPSLLELTALYNAERFAQRAAPPTRTAALLRELRAALASAARR